LWQENKQHPRILIDLTVPSISTQAKIRTPQNHLLSKRDLCLHFIHYGYRHFLEEAVSVPETKYTRKVALTLMDYRSMKQLSVFIQTFSLIAIFFEGYDQGVMGGVRNKYFAINTRQHLTLATTGKRQS